jgi:hypothetical protein
VLSVDLLDFAGGHFGAIADLKQLLDGSVGDPEEVKAVQEVDATLQRADAFVILINSREIDPINPTPARNPFSPSVEFVLNHCRENQKPVALLFSQIDQTPLLTEDVVAGMPRVQKFRKEFTDDLQTAASTGQPFGIARRVACYETVDGIIPRKQTDDGSIWFPEPAQIVADLLTAAMPAIIERLEREAKAAEEQREREELTQKQQQKRRWFGVAAALAAITIALAVLVVMLYQRNESRQVGVLETATGLLREGTLLAITPALEAQVAEILDAQQARPSGAGSRVPAAIRDLESATGEAGARLVAEPALAAPYGETIGRFQSFAAHFDRQVSERWQPTLVPLIARHELLFAWFGVPRPVPRERARYLDEAAKRFGGDHAFADLLRAEATRTKEAEVASWQASIDADPDVESRLATIQRIAASALLDPDPEFTRVARNALAAHVATTILKRSENSLLREKLLTPLVPDLARFGDGEVRFDVLARDLLNCSSQEECRGRQRVVESTASDAVTNAERWRSAVENLLRSLLLDVPQEQRREIWNAVAGALAHSYFFSGRNDAWPEGVVSLPDHVQAVGNAEEDGTLALIERLSQHPIYATEIEYLKDRLLAIEVRREMVPVYTTTLSTLSFPNSVLPFDELSQIHDELSSSFVGRPPNGPLAELSGELDQILGLVQSVNNLRSRGNSVDSLSSIRLERILREAKRGHCEALVSHKAPTECANAA